jgi:hypothetical protein
VKWFLFWKLAKGACVQGWERGGSRLRTNASLHLQPANKGKSMCVRARHTRIIPRVSLKSYGTRRWCLRGCMRGLNASTWLLTATNCILGHYCEMALQLTESAVEPESKSVVLREPQGKETRCQLDTSHHNLYNNSTVTVKTRSRSNSSSDQAGPVTQPSLLPSAREKNPPRPGRLVVFRPSSLSLRCPGRRSFLRLTGSSSPWSSSSKDQSTKRTSANGG